MEEGDHEPGDGDQKRRAEPVPETRGEGNRRRMVMLEPEPAGARRLLHAPCVARSLPEVDDDVRARRCERDQRQPDGDRQPPPRSPRGDDEGGEQQDARILGARRQPDDEAGELEPPRDHERERNGDSERERHVGDRHPRVRDVSRLDRSRRGRDEAGHLDRRRAARATTPPRPLPSAITTIDDRAVRYDGSSCHAWNGASMYMTRLG